MTAGEVAVTEQPAMDARGDAAQLELRGVTKVFVGNGREVRALSDIDLSVPRGELITVVGPSGCGKSTLLKIVAGLEGITGGSVELNGSPIAGPGPDRAVVFQEHRLMPWLTVEKNIAANLSLRNAAIRERVDRLLGITGLTGFAKAFPKELSGGMQQRVAIARALLRDPAIMLLDEPFGALDAFTRTHMQDTLLEVWEQNRTTMLFVTHDIEEAISLGDRIVLMSPRPGRIDRIIPGLGEDRRNRDSAAFEALRADIRSRFDELGRAERRAGEVAGGTSGAITGETSGGASGATVGEAG